MTHTGAPPVPSARRRWAVLAVVLFAAILDLLDGTITNIAAPAIAADLDGGQALVQWLGAAYAIAMGVLLVVGGRLGDRYGRRRLFLVGIIGFTLVSIACGLAAGPVEIIVFRLLQGSFGALLIPQGFGILGAVFPREELGKAFGVFAPALGLSAVGGPVLAGALVDADVFGLGWRAIFLINIVLGGAVIALAARLLPRDHGDPSVTVDVRGALQLAAAMLGLLYGLIDGPAQGWTVRSLSAVALGAAFFALFARRQVVAATPLIRPSLFANRGFTSGLAIGLVFHAGVAGMLLVLSLFLQNELGRTPGGASLGLAPIAVGIVIASIAAQRLVARLGRNVVLLGLALTTAGILTLLVLIHIGETAALVLPVLITGMGLGTCFGTIYEITLGDVDPAEAGSASGSFSAVQQLAGSLGVATITTVYFQTRDGAVLSLAVVAALTLACCGLVRLMPRHARIPEDRR